MHRRTFCFAKSRIFERERGNQPIGACLLLSLSIFFLFFSSKIPLSYLFSHCSFFLILVFYFLVLKFLLPWCLSPPLCTAKNSLYSACCDRILLFWPLTTFVWSGCICRPPLVRLCATPHRQTKENYLFVCLPWHPFLLWSECLLSPYPSWHAPNGSNSALLLLGGMSSQQDTSPKRARAGTSK